MRTATARRARGASRDLLPRDPHLRPGLLLGAIFAGVLLGCVPAAQRCRPVPLAPAAEERLGEWREVLDFAPITPCAQGGSLRVSAVTVDWPEGQPRMTFVVAADSTVFLLSQSRAVSGFTQVPDGATRLEWSVEGVPVVGFESPAGAGPALLYLRWESDGIIYEYQADPSRQFPAGTLREFARLNIGRTVGEERGLP